MRMNGMQDNASQAKILLKYLIILIHKESQPDPDLGHTNKFGFRNETKPGDANRVFGTPTIRDDITRKTQKSIADPNNYGDEKPSVALLFP